MVKRTGPGFAQLKVGLAGLDGIEARVGWFESARYPNGTPVATVAAAHEGGVPSINLPARPFFRLTIAERSNVWMEQVGQGAKSVLEGKRTGSQVLEIVALGAAADVGKTITRITEPPLQPETIKRKKGNAKPLVDTAQMLQALTAVVGSRK